MTNRTAKIIFYVGTLSSLVLFLILTVDTHRQVGALTHADRLSPQVIEGKRAFQKYNCNDCHTILGFGGYYSPDLTRVYSRRGEDYIRNVLQHPEIAFANSFRKMPQQHISEAEIGNLITFFKWVNDIENHDWPPQDSKKYRAANRLTSAAGVSRGAALFKENRCFDCHKLEGVGGTTGPVLDGVGERLDSETIKRHLVNPQSVNPNSTMPAYDELSSDDVSEIAEFLARQKGEGR
jgi:nitric oxide reductase subunit C